MNCVVLNRVGSLGLFCPIQDQGFRPSVAPLPPNMSQEPPPPHREGGSLALFLPMMEHLPIKKR